MLGEPITHKIIQTLLKKRSASWEMELGVRCACELFTIVGKTIDHPKAKKRIDQYFQQMENVKRKRRDISDDVKDMVRKVVELRKNNWVISSH